MKSNYLLIVCIALLLSASCAKLNVPQGYIISEAALKDSIQQNDTTLVLFWTNWCGASHNRLENYYKPLAQKVAADSLDLKIILLASDANISLEKIDAFRKLGISCFYIDQPGSTAIANRMAIKNYINNSFPENEIARIKGIQYGIPVELLMTKNLDIINELETNRSYDYIAKELDLEKK